MSNILIYKELYIYCTYCKCVQYMCIYPQQFILTSFVEVG